MLRDYVLYTCMSYFLHMNGLMDTNVQWKKYTHYEETNTKYKKNVFFLLWYTV